MLSRPNRLRLGFTLLELSIVVMIIGVLVGGVMAGGTLIRQARINRVMTDIQKYITAVTMFQTQYNALPGDMSNATKYWGAAGTPTNTWAGCYGIVGTGTQTCDGNGDGQIWATDSWSEVYRAWQHLSLAGMIEGSYSGVTAKSDGSLPFDVPGVNVPKGPIQTTGYDILYLGNYTTVTSPFTEWGPINFGHVITFGAAGATWGQSWNKWAAITPAEMASFDQKYDDGLPLSGTISADVAYAPNCATSPYTLTSTYNVTYQGVACSMAYITGF